MSTPICRQYQKYQQRTLHTGIAAAVGLAILIFLTHNSYDQFIFEATSMSDRVLDTLITIFGLLIFIIFQRGISHTLYRDFHMGMEQELRDERLRCPANKVCQRATHQISLGTALPLNPVLAIPAHKLSRIELF